MMAKYTDLGHGLPAVYRLGLATRGNTNLKAADLRLALDCDVNYWNWCGHEDGMSQAVREMGRGRSRIVLATQIGVQDWSGKAMRRELDRLLGTLGSDWLDVVTLYYVESEGEWDRIVDKDGALRALRDAQRDGWIRAIGLTTHQRHLAARWAQTGLLDMLMVRYNAAHRGAETEIFPVTDRLELPVVCFTCLRWGELLKSTENDPPGFCVPPAAEWYRFVLSNPSVSVAVMAPNGRDELLENLTQLADWRAPSPSHRSEMAAHGDRVRQTAGPFP